MSKSSPIISSLIYIQWVFVNALFLNATTTGIVSLNSNTNDFNLSNTGLGGMNLMHLFIV